MKIDIRYADPDDKAALVSLWRLCFPQDERFTAYFFDTLYRPDQALMLTVDGTPAAMLHMFPRTLHWLGQDVPVSYLYGVGTHPDFRRRGLARVLLEQALFEMHLRGVFFTVLIPQEPWLFDFYAPMGFAPVFTLPRFAFSEDPNHMGSNNTLQADADLSLHAGPEHIPLLQGVYEEAMAGRTHIHRTENHWLSVLTECAMAGGEILLVRRNGQWGFAVYTGLGGGLLESFGVCATAKGPVRPFGCLRVVNARRVLALYPSAVLDGASDSYNTHGDVLPSENVVLIQDEMAPWNNGTHKLPTPLLKAWKRGVAGTVEKGVVDPEAPVLTPFTLAQLLFDADAPYMNLMHD